MLNEVFGQVTKTQALWACGGSIVLILVVLYFAIRREMAISDREHAARRSYDAGQEDGMPWPEGKPPPGSAVKQAA